MTNSKDLTILAVTKMHGGVCTAGIDSAGNWIRPIRAMAGRDPGKSGITDYCLLPIDFFHGGRSHIANMGVTRFQLSAPSPQPPHVEDWIIDLKDKPQLLRALSEEDQKDFLASHRDRDLSVLDPASNRSLALFKADDFVFTFKLDPLRADISVRASFGIGGREVLNIGCTDLRMRQLGRQLLAKRLEPGCILTAEDFSRRGKGDVYLAVGLSRLYKGKHWMILIGVHCLPQLDVEIDYASL